MPGPRRGGPGMHQKPKNLKAALKKLLSYCRKELPVMLLALILAASGTVLTIVGPNQISKITNYIYDGLTGGVDTEEIAADIQKQISSGDLSVQEVMSWLPEGTDMTSLDFSKLDMSDSSDPAAQAILEHITLSDEYIEAHQNDGINLKGIINVTILLGVLYLFSSLCTFTQHYIMASVTLRISHRMRCDLDVKINRLPLKFFGQSSHGDVLSRVTNDVDTIVQGLNNSAASLVTSVTQFVGILIMMFITNGLLAVVTILSSLIGIVCMLVIIRKSQPHFRARQSRLGALDGYIEEMYSGHDVIRISGAEEKVLEQFNGLNAQVKEANFKSQFLGGLMQPVMNFIGNIGYVAVCIVGAMSVISGKCSFGVITAFLIYVRLFEQPLRQVAMSLTSIQSAGAASERVFEFLEGEEMPAEPDKLSMLPEQVRGEVEFRNVKFAYPEAPDKEIIHNFSAHITPGQKVAIVGPTGAGKTTIVNLLMRFYETTGGDILIDGIKTSDMQRSTVHDLFGMVLQDTWLFEGTVRENLIYNCKDISDDALVKATKACGIYSFIHALPQGFDTVLNNNTSISAGQKQLFTIARAMIQDNPMLILDEATSSVDTRTEILAQQAMDALTENRTSFVIAHRLSTIKNADIILVVRDGDIVESGCHEELLAKGGFYAELYNSQFDQTA